MINKIFLKWILIVILLLSAKPIYGISLGYDGSMPRAVHEIFYNPDVKAPKVEVISDVITFSPNDYVLNDKIKNQLTDFFKEISYIGKILNVKIAAWSDKEFPSDNRSMLSLLDRKLANSRARNIGKYLITHIGIHNLQTINMARNSNWFARVFGTTDAELKSVFAKKNSAGKLTQEQMELKVNGKPSSVVILVSFIEKKDDQKSQNYSNKKSMWARYNFYIPL